MKRLSPPACFLWLFLTTSQSHAQAPSPSARRRADAALQDAQHLLLTLRAPHNEDEAKMVPNHTYPAALAAFARLKKLIATLPDPSAPPCTRGSARTVRPRP